MRLTKSDKNHKEICGGIDFSYEYYGQNIGMKKSNGGAATILCETIKETTHLDYSMTSSHTSLYLLLDH